MFSVFIATSLDGYIARPDGGLDWLAIVEPLDESHGWAAFFASIDTIVMGRDTWEIALGYDEWPYPGKRVIVLTHRPADPLHGEEFFAGEVSELAASLQHAKRVYVDGGRVIGQFLAAHLIDDLTISVIPIVLGGGIRLFAGGEGEHRIDLESQRAWPNGMVQLCYRVRK